MQKYSEFINFPIYLQTIKEVDVPVEEEEEKAEEKAEEGEEEDEEEGKQKHWATSKSEGGWGTMKPMGHGWAGSQIVELVSLVVLTRQLLQQGRHSSLEELLPTSSRPVLNCEERERGALGGTGVSRVHRTRRQGVFLVLQPTSRWCQRQ